MSITASCSLNSICVNRDNSHIWYVPDFIVLYRIHAWVILLFSGHYISLPLYNRFDILPMLQLQTKDAVLL